MVGLTQNYITHKTLITVLRPLFILCIFFSDFPKKSIIWKNSIYFFGLLKGYKGQLGATKKFKVIFLEKPLFRAKKRGPYHFSRPKNKNIYTEKRPKKLFFTFFALKNA